MKPKILSSKEIFIVSVGSDTVLIGQNMIERYYEVSYVEAKKLGVKKFDFGCKIIRHHESRIYFRETKMIIPKTINILGFEYEVRLHDICDKERDGGYFGYCDHHRLRITINNKAAPQQQEATLLHEILEAINQHNELNMPHNVIQTLETSLYQVLKENDIDFTK
jgi:hypothetical protein